MDKSALSALKYYLSEADLKICRIHHNNISITIVFYVRHSNLISKNELTIPIFFSKDEKYLKFINMVDTFIDNINQNVNCILHLNDHHYIYNDLSPDINNDDLSSNINNDDSSISHTNKQNKQNKQTKETKQNKQNKQIFDKFMIYNIHRCDYTKAIIEFKDNDIIFGDNTISNCKKCTLELLNFIKNISLVESDPEYTKSIINIIKSIDLKLQEIHEMDVKEDCRFFFFKKLDLNNYERLYNKLNNILKKYVNVEFHRQHDQVFPIYYCDEKKYVNIISNIGKYWCEAKGFKFDKNVTKYYVITDVENNIYYIPSYVLDSEL